MSYVIPFLALASLVIGWALWQRHRDPYIFVRMSPEWQRARESYERMATVIGEQLTPAFRRVGISASEAASAFAALAPYLPQEDLEEHE